MTNGSPLSIVHMMQWFELGGGESVALHLASKQVAAGHDVSVVALSATGPLIDEFRRSGAKVEVVPHWRPGFDPTIYVRLLSRFIKTRPDVVHTHDPHSLIYASGVGRAALATVIHTKHGVDAAAGRALHLQRAAGRFVSAMVAVSDETAQSARAHNEVPEKKLRVIKNGIDVDAFNAQPELRQVVRKELGIAPDAFVVGTVGRLETVKNHALLVRAAGPLAAEGMHVVIVGDGTERERLEQLRAQSPAPQNIHLLGMRRDIARLLQSFDVFAISSLSEGLPLALLEAMATSLAIVSTAVGGIPAVIEAGTSGLLVDSEDEQGLRAQLAALAADRERATELARAARLLVEQRFSLDHTLAQYMDLYRAL